MENSEKVPTLREPEELIFDACYAPVQLDRLIESAEGRSRVRRVPVPQLYFGVRNLSEDQIVTLLPHVTEEQWQGIVDLDIWDRDRPATHKFLDWERLIVVAADPVARKLIRAVDPELWMLSFQSHLEIVPLSEDDPIVTPGTDREWVDTPDGHFRIFLPDVFDAARFFRELIGRMYALDPVWTSLLLTNSFVTKSELVEECYQKRKNRIEDLGFRDYFDSVDIYVPLEWNAALPEKRLSSRGDLTVTPIRTGVGAESLLLEALSQAADPEAAHLLLEELFFVTNKLLSADRVSPADRQEMKRSIRKVFAGVNLGLDCWSEGNLARAIEGARRHYLQSFFQIGYGRLLRLKKWAQRVAGGTIETGSLSEELLEALRENYPRTVEVVEGKVVRRFFETRDDVERVEQILRSLEAGI